MIIIIIIITIEVWVKMIRPPSFEGMDLEDFFSCCSLYVIIILFRFRNIWLLIMNWNQSLIFFDRILQDEAMTGKVLEGGAVHGSERNSSSMAIFLTESRAIDRLIGRVWEERIIALEISLESSYSIHHDHDHEHHH